MDYKNLYLRTITSSVLILFFSIFIFFNEYLPIAIFLIYILLLIESIIYFNKIKFKLFFLILYLFISFICAEIYLIYFFNLKVFIFFILIMIFFDTSSYLFGSFVGNKKILPNISPNKTYEGLLLGFISTIFLVLIFNYFILIFNFIYLLFFTFIIIMSSFIGDIIESFFKRLAKIKNSSNFLPGHGGIFDRLDGFILSIIVLLFFELL